MPSRLPPDSGFVVSKPDSRFAANARLMVLAAALFLSLPCTAADLMGQATVIDGDTIEIHGQRIRLHGVDVPEAVQTCEADHKVYRCGQQAALALADLIGRKVVTCEDRGRDRYDRMIAVCRTSSQDVGGWMIEQGWALAFRRYSVAYVWQEQAAESARRGMWSGPFVPPWEWRKGNSVEKP